MWLWNNQSEIYLYKSVIQQLFTTPSNSFWIFYKYILMDLYWISYIHSTTNFYYFIFYKQFSQGCARYMNLNLVWNLNLLYITRDTWLITSTISSRVNILEFPCIPLTMRVFLVSVSQYIVFDIEHFTGNVYLPYISFTIRKIKNRLCLTDFNCTNFN